MRAQRERCHVEVCNYTRTLIAYIYPVVCSRKFAVFFFVVRKVRKVLLWKGNLRVRSELQCVDSPPRVVRRLSVRPTIGTYTVISPVAVYVNRTVAYVCLLLYVYVTTYERCSGRCNAMYA